MPNQRGENQRLLTVPVDADFLKQLTAHMVQAGYTNRSQFVRDAIVEKLAAQGINIPKNLGLPPVRTRSMGAYEFNDAPIKRRTRPAAKKAKAVSGGAG